MTTTVTPTDLGRPSSPSQISVVPNIEEYVRLHRPESVLTLELSRARIVVVAAKRPGYPWDPVARVHIEQARRSYHRLWGEVPLWDRFDDLDTTSQYIAYVLYRTADGHFEHEALTGRLVRDEPDDVSFYTTDGSSLREILADRLSGPVAGDSRIGSTRPRSSARNAYTLEAFAATRLAMMAEARSDGLHYVACQLRPDLDRRVLRKEGVHFGFPRAEDLLRIEPGTVRLDRRNLRVLRHLFEYPGYFLDSIGVLQMMQRAIQYGVVQLDAIRRATGCTNLEELCLPRNLYRLVPLLNGPDEPGSHLRAGMAREVPDGVYSSLATTTAYQDRAWRVLRVRKLVECWVGVG